MASTACAPHDGASGERGCARPRARPSEPRRTRRARPSGHCPGRRARSALGSPRGSPSGWLQRTRRAAACVRPPEARESLSRERSGRQPVATLAPALGDDRPTGTSAHPKTEPVRLGPSPVVRLERPLAHRKTPSKGGKGTLAPPTHRRPDEPTVVTTAGQTRLSPPPRLGPWRGQGDTP